MRKISFSSALEDVTKFAVKVPKENYLDKGNFPIIDQGKDYIGGYWNDTNGLYKEVPSIVFGDHTRAIKYITTPFYIGADGVKVLKVVNNNDNPKYYYYALQAARIPDLGYSRHFKIVKELTFNMHNRTEQDKIVKKLDKLENLIKLMNHQLNKLNELTQSRFIEMFGDPVANPMNWNKLQLQEVVADDCSISYGIVQTGDEEELGVPVFRPIDIVNRTPELEELKKTTKEISDKYKRTILKGREMLITVRANIADTCIVGEEFAGCNVGRGIVPIRTKEDIIVLEFLKHQIDSKGLNDAIKGLAKGITLVQLNMEDLRKIELIIPPLESQKKFISFANQIDKSKLVVKQSLEKLQILKKSLMQNYFG